MTNYVVGRKRHDVARAASAPTHKFIVGLYVLYRGRHGSGRYRVTKLLPDEGAGQQYRIRSDRDGQERVVIESDLQRSI